MDWGSKQIYLVDMENIIIVNQTRKVVYDYENGLIFKVLENISKTKIFPFFPEVYILLYLLIFFPNTIIW